MFTAWWRDAWNQHFSNRQRVFSVFHSKWEWNWDILNIFEWCDSPVVSVHRWTVNEKTTTSQVKITCAHFRHYFFSPLILCVCAKSIMLSWLIPHSSSSDWHQCAKHTSTTPPHSLRLYVIQFILCTINLSLSLCWSVFCCCYYSKTRCKNIDREPFHLIWNTQQRQITIACVLTVWV